MVAIGGDVRFAASQILDDGGRRRACAKSPRDAVPGVLRGGRAAGRGAAGRAVSTAGRRSRDAGAVAARLPDAARRDAARASWSCPDASLRTGVLLDLADPGGRSGAEEFEQQVLASAEALGQKTASIARTAATSRCWPCSCSTSCRDDHGLGRPRAAAAAGRGAAARHRPLRQPARASQALAVPAGGVADLRPVGRRDGDRREHRALPSPRAAADEPPAVRGARSRRTGSSSNKLAAILRVANALDAEHLQKVRGAAARPTRASLDPRDRRDGRPDDGAAGGDRARRHVRRDVRPASWSSGRGGAQA